MKLSVLHRLKVASRVLFASKERAWHSDEAAWQAYERVRDAVAKMKVDAADGVARPSEYWNAELANIDYLADASPLVIRKLRHHAFWITGLRAYDYRVQDDVQRDLFEMRLRALTRIGGADLVVAEPEVLGGFGYRIDGALYNLDTLKFLEVLVGLRTAGILDPLRAADRPVIVEVGGGWGGLAGQLRTLIPHALYVIVDLPELFLFSAVHLSTVFPGARQVFWGAEPDAAERWRKADFVFVPNTHAGAVSALAPSLVINVASFQEMTAAQVDAYASIAARGGCQTIYSLNRERSRYNLELTSVSDVLSRYYDLREIAVLDTDYTKAMKKRSKSRKADAAPSADDALSYKHIVGQLRASP